MVVNWSAASWGNLIVGNLNRNMDKAGIYLVSTMRKNVNTGQPYTRYTGRSGVTYKGLNPSRPGQFPHKITGQLQRSMAWRNDKANGVLRVGSALNYAGWLQTGTRTMQPRPWLSLTWAAEKDKVGSIILRG